jgi:hypothetical protein
MVDVTLSPTRWVTVGLNAYPAPDSGRPSSLGACAQNESSFGEARTPATAAGRSAALACVVEQGVGDGSGGIYATAFDDRPAVMATMAYLVSAEFADTRARLTDGDFLSPNRNVDTSVYPGRQQALATILSTAEPVRFDASDLMPGVVGADAFWQAVVNITRGASVAEEFAAVEAVWPDG